MQVTVALLAMYTSASRVTDNRHHASDVVAGAILGLVVALYTVSIILELSANASRVTNNRHHAGDVVDGALLGLVVALYTVSTGTSG